jgi:c-di-AMP phosphodiesterase-like protein
MFKIDLDEFIDETKFESNMSDIMIYRNGIGIAVYEADMNIQASSNAGAKAADKILTIDGVTASFVVFKPDDTVRISARSLGGINVQIILEALGGGGRFDAAGAQIKNATVKEVVAMLQKTIDEYFDIV